MKNKWMPGRSYPLMLAVTYGDGHSRRQHGQVHGMRARRAGIAGIGLQIVVRWIVSMTGVSNATAVDRMPILRSVASIDANVLSEIANANVAETAMETESVTGNTASASGILSGIETGANVTAIATGNETVNVTANEVTGTDGKKRIAIERAGRTAKSAVGRYSLPRTAVNLLGQVIALLPLLRRHSGSEEDLPTMMYAHPLSSTGPASHRLTLA
jgi:hypothetical protein